jgi:hypothetical protein
MSLGVMKLAAVLLLLGGASAQAAQCLCYSNPVALQGVLSRRTFPEQPNYENIANGDAKASYFFLSPSKPFCVDQGNAVDGSEPAEPRVTAVQLVLPDGAVSYQRLRPYLGKVVICDGNFFHAITGHHHSPVLLDAATCRPSRHAIGAAPKAAQADSLKR